MHFLLFFWWSFMTFCFILWSDFGWNSSDLLEFSCQFWKVNFCGNLWKASDGRWRYLWRVFFIEQHPKKFYLSHSGKKMQNGLFLESLKYIYLNHSRKREEFVWFYWSCTSKCIWVTQRKSNLHPFTGVAQVHFFGWTWNPLEPASTWHCGKSTLGKVKNF
jgi:hypothetical protein